MQTTQPFKVIWHWFFLLDVSVPLVNDESAYFVFEVISIQNCGCPATWKTWKCEGISMQGEKVRERSGKSEGIYKKKQEKLGKSQVTVREFCCKKFTFSQSEHPNSENFLGEHGPRP